MSEYLRGPVLALGAIAAAIFLVALVLLIGMGDFGFGSALFLALLITLLASIIVYLAFPRHLESLNNELPKLKGRAAEELPKLRDKAREEFPKIKTRISEEIPRIKDQAAKARDGISENFSSLMAKTQGKTADQDKDVSESEAVTTSTATSASAPVAKASPEVQPVPSEPTPQAPPKVAPKVAEMPPVAAPATTTGDAAISDPAAKPAALEKPNGEADDLKKIKGVGPKLESTLNENGIYHFSQIASWTEAEVAWMDDNLQGFKGRVSRDSWVEQAELLSSGGQTDFSKKVDGGDVY